MASSDPEYDVDEMEEEKEVTVKTTTTVAKPKDEKKDKAARSKMFKIAGSIALGALLILFALFIYRRFLSRKKKNDNGNNKKNNKPENAESKPPASSSAAPSDNVPPAAQAPAAPAPVAPQNDAVTVELKGDKGVETVPIRMVPAQTSSNPVNAVSQAWRKTEYVHYIHELTAVEAASIFVLTPDKQRLEVDQKGKKKIVEMTGVEHDASRPAPRVIFFVYKESCKTCISASYKFVEAASKCVNNCKIKGAPIIKFCALNSKHVPLYMENKIDPNLPQFLVYNCENEALGSVRVKDIPAIPENFHQFHMEMIREYVHVDLK